MTVADLRGLFASVKTILVIDWPSKDVPEALARAGFQVIVKGGPGPSDFAAYEVENGQVVRRGAGCTPTHADLVYSYRPLDELPGIIDTAKSLGAGVLWTQSGFSTEGLKDATGCWAPEEERLRARALARSAGLTYIDEPFIADAVRDLKSTR